MVPLAMALADISYWPEHSLSLKPSGKSGKNWRWQSAIAADAIRRESQSKLVGTNLCVHLVDERRFE